MPPVAIAAGVTAAGQLGGAILASRSANRGLRASTAAADKAEAFAREQEATRQKERAEEKALEAEQRRLEQQQWDAREQRRADVLARYGRNYTPKPYAPGGLAPVVNPYHAAAQPSSLGAMFSGGTDALTPALQAPPPPMFGQRRSLGSMFGGDGYGD